MVAGGGWHMPVSYESYLMIEYLKSTEKRPPGLWYVSGMGKKKEVTFLFLENTAIIKGAELLIIYDSLKPV